MWNSADGNFTVEAKLIEVKSEVVTLQRKDDRRIEVAIDKLSIEDRKYAQSKGDADR